jgi:hypothetical protein
MCVVTEVGKGSKIKVRIPIGREDPGTGVSGLPVTARCDSADPESFFARDSLRFFER